MKNVLILLMMVALVGGANADYASGSPWGIAGNGLNPYGFDTDGNLTDLNEGSGENPDLWGTWGGDAQGNGSVVVSGGLCTFTTGSYELAFAHDNALVDLGITPGVDYIELIVSVVSISADNALVKIEQFPESVSFPNPDNGTGAVVVDAWDPPDFGPDPGITGPGVYSFVTAAPADATAVAVTPVIGVKNGTLVIDEIWIGKEGTYTSTKATNPNPDDGAVVYPFPKPELSWTTPEPNNLAYPITVDVFILDGGTSPLTEDPNLYEGNSSGATQLLDDAVAVTTATIPSGFDILEDHYYYWAVNCTDPTGGPNGAVETLGDIWTFNTVNTAPTAVAAADKNHWLKDGTVDVQLDASGSFDDGYPGDPLTYTWTQVSGPSLGSIDAVESPVVTITAAGTYEFSVQASDGLLTSAASDPVTIYVYLESETSLVGHWKFEGDLNPTVGTPIGVMQHSGAGPAPAPTFSTGQVGQALQLSDTTWAQLNKPTGGGKTAATDADLSITDEITISAWVKTNQSPFDDWAGIVTKGDSSWRIATATGDSAQAAFGNWQDAEGFIEANGSENIEDGEWNHVVGIHDGVKVKVYINGYLGTVADVTVPLQLDVSPTVYDILFGSNAESNAILNGQIDEVRIFNKGLSERRVIDIFVGDGGGAGGVCGGNYAQTDLDQDCRTDQADLLLFLDQWLDCTDLTGVNCGN